MTEIAGVYPKVRIEAPGAPEPLIEDVVYDSMRDFFRDSECWRYTVPGLLDWTTALGFPALNAGTEIPTGTRVKRIDEVKYASDGASLRTIPFRTKQELDCIYSDWEVKTGSAPLAWTHDAQGGESPLIIPTATADVTGSLKVRAILVPTTLTDIPSFFYDEFHDAWRWGALFRLLKMPGKDWSNDALGVFYESKYNEEIKMAKSRANAEFGQPNNRVMAYGGI